MKILLIEDELKIADFVLQGFSQVGFETDHFTQGTVGLKAALTGEYDAIVLDLMLPGMDGIEVLSNIRQSGSAIPVIILTAKGDLSDRLIGFEAGRKVAQARFPTFFEPRGPWQAYPAPITEAAENRQPKSTKVEPL